MNILQVIKNTVIASVFLVILLSAGLLPAEEQSVDPFSELNRGDRIRITLKDGQTLTGEIKFMSDKKLILSVTYEETLLKGSIGIIKDQIITVEKLDPISQSEKRDRFYEKHLELDRLQQKAETDKWKIRDTSDDFLPTETTEPETQPEETVVLDPDRLLNNFPPDEGWGERKYQAIRQKQPWQISTRESEFLKSYEQWKTAKSLKEKEARQKLLEKFPPSNGWGEEKYKEITTRFIRVGVNPHGPDKEFAGNFEDWKKALQEHEAEEKIRKEKEAAAAKSAPEENPPSPPMEKE